MRLFYLLFVGLMVLVSGCGRDSGGKGQNCQPTPVGPSCVEGKVDANNLPAGPGPGVRASATYAVYEGDCPDNPSLCSRELFATDDSALQIAGRDRTYVLKNGVDKHTLRMCVTHPQVPGRKIATNVDKVFSNQKREFFDEAEPTKKSPYCMGITFDMLINGGRLEKTGVGEVSFTESNQDLLSPTDWKITLGFRIP